MDQETAWYGGVNEKLKLEDKLPWAIWLGSLPMETSCGWYGSEDGQLLNVSMVCE